MTMDNQPNQASTQLVVDLAKALISTLQERIQGWRRAYIRFHASDGQYGSNGSYITDNGIFLFDPFEFGELFDRLNESGFRLRKELTRNDKKFCLFLLRVDSNFDFHIDYEWNDCSRWKITKMDGASGLPEGVVGN